MSREWCVQVWEEVWQEGTPGSEGGIRLYLSEIMEVLPKVNPLISVFLYPLILTCFNFMHNMRPPVVSY
jgi:hypothetical protein